MGLTRQMVRFVIREAKYSPLRGSVLLLGRQTIHLTADSFAELMKEEEMPIDSSIPLELDTRTRGSEGKNFISDSYLFKVLGAENVQALDVSNYEGAEIVHDLGAPIPDELAGKFDFVCDGSVFDNMFTPAIGLTNSSRLLAPGGRVIHFEHASNGTNQAYLQFSPNWFFDYYVVNRYADCKCYLAFFTDLHGPWEFVYCVHTGKFEPSILSSPRLAMTCVIAEKAADSTWDQIPIQGEYRDQPSMEMYLSHRSRILRSARPVMSPSRKWPGNLARNDYVSLGTFF